MRDLRTLGPWLRRFLADYIVVERHLAANTQKSYRDSFKLLLLFVSTKVHKPVDRLDVEDLTPSRVLQFLAHLEEERDCSVQTRNQRLTAIRSFARFVAFFTSQSFFGPSAAFFFAASARARIASCSRPAIRLAAASSAPGWRRSSSVHSGLSVIASR